MQLTQEIKNYYDVLEIPTDSTLQDIHNAYRISRNAYSEDSAALYSIMTSDDCEKVLEQVEEAYSILGVPDKRREYDFARNLNQEHTPEGFTTELHSKPNYKPQKSIDEVDEQEEKVAELVKTKSLKEEFQYQEKPSIESLSYSSKIQAANKFGLDYDMSNDFEEEIANCAEFTGDFLTKIREYKNVSIERMSEMTKISRTYIRNIEGDEFSKMPADVYTRGFVYQYAKCLKLNPELVANSYINYLKQMRTPLS